MFTSRIVHIGIGHRIFSVRQRIRLSRGDSWIAEFSAAHQFQDNELVKHTLYTLPHIGNRWKVYLFNGIYGPFVWCCVCLFRNFSPIVWTICSLIMSPKAQSGVWLILESPWPFIVYTQEALCSSVLLSLFASMCNGK